jgi:uncharacterized protein YpmB
VNRTNRAIGLLTVVVLAALVSAQDSVEVAKAPYLTDVAQAQSEAAQKGQDALIYFYMDT